MNFYHNRFLQLYVSPQCMQRLATHYSAMPLWSSYHLYIFPTTHTRFCNTLQPTIITILTPHYVQLTQTFMVTLLPSNSLQMHKSYIHKHKPSTYTQPTKKYIQAEHTLQQALHTSNHTAINMPNNN